MCLLACYCMSMLSPRIDQMVGPATLATWGLTQYMCSSASMSRICHVLWVISCLGRAHAVHRKQQQTLYLLLVPLRMGPLTCLAVVCIAFCIVAVLSQKSMYAIHELAWLHQQQRQVLLRMVQTCMAASKHCICSEIMWGLQSFEQPGTAATLVLS